MNVVPLPIVLSIATLAAFTAYAADSSLMQAPGSFDWFGLVKDAGAVGICVWMLVWFQRRSDAQRYRQIRPALIEPQIAHHVDIYVLIE